MYHHIAVSNTGKNSQHHRQRNHYKGFLNDEGSFTFNGEFRSFRYFSTASSLLTNWRSDVRRKKSCVTASHLSRRLKTSFPNISSSGFNARRGAHSIDYSKSLSLGSRGYFFHVATIIRTYKSRYLDSLMMLIPVISCKYTLLI